MTMRTTWIAAVVVAAVAVGTGPLAPRTSAAGGDRADRGGLVMAGAASRSVLPLVDGSLD
jgi:hypothetical protein